MTAAMSAPSGFPTISVVIPTHARPQLLARAVKSVLGQDYPGDIECLVVFDQATPHPVPVETGPGRSISTLVNERTPGLAGARNAGALAATGDVLGFLDDDDEWLRAKLRLQVELMRSERTHVVACGIYLCRDGRQIDRVAKPRVTYQDLLRSRHMEVNPCSLLVERGPFLTEIGLVDEQIPGSYGEDYEWLLRAARTGDIISVRRPLVRIHWHGSSYFARDWETIAAAHRYLLSKYPDFASQPAGLARVSGQLSFALAATGDRTNSRRWAAKALRLAPREPRAYLAMVASTGLIRPETMLRMANAFGRGV